MWSVKHKSRSWIQYNEHNGRTNTNLQRTIALCGIKRYSQLIDRSHVHVSNRQHLHVKQIWEKGKALRKHIVGNHSLFFRYTPYVPQAIWLAKYRFHEYVWGREDQSSSNGIAFYNSLQSQWRHTGIFLLKIESNAHVLNGKPNLRYKT